MDKKCPLFKEPCREHGCKWYIQLMGKNPQTGQAIAEFDCVINWLPVLLIENSQQSRQVGAAVESLRNVVAEEGVRREIAAALPQSDRILLNKEVSK